MDGLEAMRRMRAIEGLNAGPIIAVSAGAMSDDKARSLAAGATAFLSKPVDHDTLMQTITRHLRLDWVDGKPELALPSNADTGPMVVPPQVEIEALHKLAVMGKMRDIKAQTEHLEIGRAHV